MDILVNPNVGYLVLMVSMLITLLAILSPGTGILEITALTMMMLCGWFVVQLPTQLWALLLMLLGFVPLILAAKFNWQPLYLASSIIISLIGAAFFFKGENWYPGAHPVLIIILSILDGSVFWYIARKTLEAHQQIPVQDLSQLIGAIGETRTNVHHEGTIFVNGELWSARSTSLIPNNRPVRVTGRDGLILLVEEIKP